MLQLRFEEESEHEKSNGFSNSFGEQASASMAFISCSFVGNDSFVSPELELDEKVQLYGNYRGSRHLIVAEKGAYMTLAKVKGGATIEVSSCNVSDVSTSSTSKEKICPGDNQCRMDGLKQGPNCVPIRPGEGRLKYPRPL
jgi:hypothetical protein